MCDCVHKKKKKTQDNYSVCACTCVEAEEEGRSCMHLQTVKIKCNTMFLSSSRDEFKAIEKTKNKTSLDWSLRTNSLYAFCISDTKLHWHSLCLHIDIAVTYRWKLRLVGYRQEAAWSKKASASFGYWTLIAPKHQRYRPICSLFFLGYKIAILQGWHRWERFFFSCMQRSAVEKWEMSARMSW